jgi:hypothetical protein
MAKNIMKNIKNGLTRWKNYVIKGKTSLGGLQ